MVSVNAIALSGLRANEQRLAVASDNIANANTPNFKAQQVQQTPLVGGGVTTQVVPQNQASITPQPVEGEVPSDVSLERELVETNIASYNFKANLKVLQAEKKIQDSLLDIQA